MIEAKRVYGQIVFLIFLLGAGFCVSTPVSAQGNRLKPGFDKDEYVELIRLTALNYDSIDIARPTRSRRIYRSREMALDNRWEYWVRDDNVGIISIRGTTLSSVSWLANFYAAMVPAAGELHLTRDDVWKYRLADHPKAAVHIGWLIATAYLSRDIIPKIDSSYRRGIKEYLIIGHSQGGAISFLLNAYLQNQKGGLLPQDLRIKTYCSAGPKPGNLYFAYDYEAMTQGGWAWNVVNSADWVPETPVSIQTINDFNKTNPFVNARTAIRKQPFAKRLALRYIFNKLDKPTRKAQRQYQRFLGQAASRIVQKNLTGYQTPRFYESSHYVRTGNTIVLKADEDYFKQYPDSDKQIFIHHVFQPYLFLVDKLKP
ncbi:lipase family protein [Larkinella soli]|uniref:lipase family protein n=1 Tax=Larkinella soli TaxID=1770527 RepID=UPI000FFBB0E4|nr:lipase family protein [Larkinella soli]